MSKKKRKKRAVAAPAPPSPPRVQRGADGRLHLALHRDVNGHEHVTLNVPVFADAWQNEIAAGAANSALAIFGERPSLERAVELARRAMSATSRLAEGLLARAAAGSVACKAGCDHCCHQSVGVTTPEALAIVAHLKQVLPVAELAAFAALIAERFARTRELSADQRFSPDLPCPFLVAGQCSIYEVRPLVCRGMNSLDAKECELRLRDPQARAAFLAQGSGGHCFLEPIRAAQAVSAGVQLGLSELYGLDMRPVELTAALHLLLSGPAASDASWLAGEMPLAAGLQSPAAVSPRP